VTQHHDRPAPSGTGDIVAAAEAVLAAAASQGSAHRRLTIEHGVLLVPPDTSVLLRLFRAVDAAVHAAGAVVSSITVRSTAITWTVWSCQDGSREAIQAAQAATEQTAPSWTVTVDDHP